MTKIIMTARNFVYPMGGFEEHIYQVAKRVGAIVAATGLFYDGENDPLIVKRFPFRNLWGYCYSKQLKEFLENVSTDIIHAQGWGSYSTVAAFNVAKNRNIPFVLTMHEFQHTKFPKSLIEKVYNMTCGRNIFTNSNMIALTKRQENFFKKFTDKVWLIPNGVNIQKKNNSFKKKYGLDDYILSIGRIAKYKRFDMLIKSAGNRTIVICGKDWGDRNRLEKLAKKLSVDVRFMELNEQDKVNALHEAGLYVSTSSREGFGITLLEALACNTKILATLVGVAPDLPKKYCEIFSNNKELEKLISENFNVKINSKSFVKKNYTWDIVGEKTKQMYEVLE